MSASGPLPPNGSYSLFYFKRQSAPSSLSTVSREFGSFRVWPGISYCESILFQSMHGQYLENVSKNTHTLMTSLVAAGTQNGRMMVQSVDEFDENLFPLLPR